MKSLLIFALGVFLGVAGHAYLSPKLHRSLDSLSSLLPSTLATSSGATVPLGAASPAQRFPVERTLTNRDGASIAARLLARNAREVLLVRLPDNRGFRYPIALLCDKDQAFVRSFAETALPAGSATEAATVSAVSTEELRLLQRRSEVEHQIDILNMDLAKRNDPNPRRPQDETERQLNACRNLLVSIDQQLSELRFGHRP